MPGLRESTRAVPPRLGRWIVLLLVLFALAATLTIGLWPAHATTNGIRFWIAIGVTPLAAWATLFSLRVMVYSNAAEAATILNDERARLMEQWRRWGGRRVAVLAAVVLTPDTRLVERVIAAEALTFHPAEGRQIDNYDKNSLIERRREALHEWLLAQLGESLTALSGDIEVVAPTASGEELTDQADALSKTMKSVSVGALRNHVLAAQGALSPGALFAQWADVLPLRPRLIVATQLWREGVSGDFTEACAAMLVMPAGLVTASRVHPVAWLYRPMPSDAEHLAEDLEIMLASQNAFASRSNWWLSGMDQSSSEVLFKQLSDREATRSGKETEVVPINVDTLIGPAGPVREWIALSMACRAASIGKIDQFCAVGGEGEFMLARVEGADDRTE
jgi:hypothetical protein